ncbi:MAG: hypothetical protein OEV66_04975 [Spirochaetia bacterium]|nr:hypothetical protein [Spirochaetia bacterium]
MFIPKEFEQFNPGDLYEYDEKNNTYDLNIAVNSFKDLYNSWDYSPYRKRDINEALIKYIEECSSEIPIRHKMSLHLYLPESETNFSAEQEKEGSMALRSYFRYLLHKKKQEKNKYYKNAAKYAFSGLVSLTLAYISQKTGVEASYLPILPEGLYIGGWVLFWEVFSIIFFRISKISEKMKEYSRLSDAEITYHFGKKFPQASRPESPREEKRNPLNHGRRITDLK